jgi:hypothetical protein
MGRAKEIINLAETLYSTCLEALGDSYDKFFIKVLTHSLGHMFQMLKAYDKAEEWYLQLA